MAQLVDYRFEREWVDHAAVMLKLYERMNWNGNTPTIELIVADTLGDARVFLEFSKNVRAYNEEQEPHPLKKQDFIRKITSEERAYLTRVFEEGALDIRFSAYNGSYELFYPYRENGKTIVLYFNEHARYGEISS
jgi:RNase adaptor protein for sRNA GlmZ degradation